MTVYERSQIEKRRRKECVAPALHPRSHLTATDASPEDEAYGPGLSGTLASDSP